MIRHADELDKWLELFDQKESARGFGSPRLTPFIPHKPTPKQRAFLCLPHREAFYGGAAGGGKQVKTDEIMHFWRSGRCTSEPHCIKMQCMIGTADIIRVGDFLIGSDGCPKKILAKSSPEFREFYRVWFDDGTHLDVSDNHLWTVFDLSKRAPGEKERGTFQTTVTTEWLFNTPLKYRTQNRFAIPILSGPVDGPSIAPELPPYTLGYWLGNGCNRGSTLTRHKDDASEICSYVEHELDSSLTCKIYDSEALRAKILLKGWIQRLRSVGWEHSFVKTQSRTNTVFNKGSFNLRWREWSASDRLLLLAGLLDSDGHANHRGDIEFDSSEPSIIFLVHGLMQSLGMKPSYPMQRHSGRENEKPMWRLCATTTRQVFRLKRKADRVRLSGHQPRQFRRYVTSIEAIGFREGVCFAVDAEDHLYAAGQNYIVTHNSDALLMGALQYVDVPGYSALILRKTLVDARKPSSIMFRARTWLQKTNARWVSEENAWHFPTDGADAIVQFGKLGQIGDAESYQSTEYQYIAGDEATHFTEWDWDYVTSRLRRPKCPEHKHIPGGDRECPTCIEFGPLARVPLRIRAASNPGGVGHLWVKRRYKIERIPGRINSNGRPLFMGTDPERPHIPAFIEDNPYIDDEYRETLQAMSDPITRERLLAGDWGVQEDSRFKLGWVRRAAVQWPWCRTSPTDLYDMRKTGERFTIIDPAASHENTPGTRSLSAKKQASYTVITTYFVTPQNLLVIIDVRRIQKEAPECVAELNDVLKTFSPQFIGMEFTTMSTHLYQLLRRKGYNMRAFKPQSQDKIQRSIDAQNMMEDGRIWLPEHAPWLRAFEDEIFTWTGAKEETDDQVDTLSYAGIYMSKRPIHKTVSTSEGPEAIL